MNWYKISQENPPIQVTSLFSDGRMGVYFGGRGPYYYSYVNPYLYDKIKRLIGYKNYKEVNKILDALSGKNKKTDKLINNQPKKHEQLTFDF